MAESSRDPTDPLRTATVLASDVLAAPPAGILTDFDGTLSPIVADPALARLVDGADAALGALVRRLAVVAVITGRAPLEARRLVDTPGVLVAGNHGTEWLAPDDEAPVASPHTDRVRPLLVELASRVPTVPGVAVEDKGLSLTVHVRAAEDPLAAADRVLASLGAPPPGIEIRPGRRSLEIRPTGIGDKGVATRAIVERYGLRGVVVLGDDVTDLDMFAAIRDLRERGMVRGVVVAVGGEDGEVPRAVAAAADAVLASPADAALLLAALADGFDGEH